jgi:aminoglycoside phosphotransferase (APT) family kinase protein
VRDDGSRAHEHRALVGRLFAELEIDSFEPIGTGWACDTYEVNGRWIVQLPRSQYAAEHLKAQMFILPRIAREVSALVPAPELVSSDPPCMGYRKIEGVPVDVSAGIDGGLWPERLGRFLFDLHMVPPEFVGMRAAGAEHARSERREEWSRMRAAVGPLLAPAELARADAMMAALLDDDRNWRFSTCLTHNDLGPEHVLVSDTGDLVGVIDWEEAAVADPAVDFAWWLHEMPHHGERALAAYGGEPDARFRVRARAAYGLMPWHEVEYGLGGGGEAFVDSGVAGVRDRLP